MTKVNQYSQKNCELKRVERNLRNKLTIVGNVTFYRRKEPIEKIFFCDQTPCKFTNRYNVSVQYGAYIFRAEGVLKQKQTFTTKRAYMVTFYMLSFP